MPRAGFGSSPAKDARFLRDAKIDIVPVDTDLADRAMSGWRRYGKGRHPAELNFGA
jgi:ribonuclease VapC